MELFPTTPSKRERRRANVALVARNGVPTHPLLSGLPGFAPPPRTTNDGATQRSGDAHGDAASDALFLASVT